MIDWNKRNGGFLSPESVYEDQLGNLSYQIDEKNKEIERLNKKIEEIQKINLADHKYASEMEDKYITTNNIINELEKKLLELRLTDVDGKTIVYRLLDKLQELKGDGSND